MTSKTISLSIGAVNELNSLFTSETDKKLSYSTKIIMLTHEVKSLRGLRRVMVYDKQQQ